MSLLALATLISSLACSSSGGSGGSSPASPYGLFLRPDGETDVKVYSNGRGLLPANSDGRTNEIIIGIFENDRLTPYNIEDEEDGAGDDISVDYSYSLAANAGDDYRNTLFNTNNNQLTFIGENSGVFGQTPPRTLSIETTRVVTIELPDGSRSDAEADGRTADDATNIDDREFSFSGGKISRTEDNPSSIDVAAGSISVADAEGGTDKIISFAGSGLPLPTTPDVSEYYVIVTDENNDGVGEVGAVSEAELQALKGTEFYVLGTVGAHAIPTITIDNITFTDKSGGGIAKIKFTFKSTTGVTVEIVDGDTISIKAHHADTLESVLMALDIDVVKALVDVTTTDDYLPTATIQNSDIGRFKLSRDEATDNKAQVNIGGLIIKAVTAGQTGDNISLFGIPSGTDDSTVAITELSDQIFVTYGNQATLADMIEQINTGTDSESMDANALIDFVGVAGTDYDSATLLADALSRLHSLAEDGSTRVGADPTANPTGELIEMLANAELKKTSNDDSASVTFTAEAAGIEGNNIGITFASNGTNGVEVALASTNNISITYESATSNLQDLVDAFASGTLDANVDALLATLATTGAAAMKSELIKPHGNNSITFTAKAAGAAGNGINITFDGTAAANSGVTITLESTNNIKIAYESNTSNLGKFKEAFSALGTNITGLIEYSLIGDFDSTLLSALFTDGTESLGGGADSPLLSTLFTDETQHLGTTQIIHPDGSTSTQNTPFQRETFETLDTEDYIINLAP